MRRFVSLSLFGSLSFSLIAQSTIYVCAASTKDYVVGAKLAPSGVFRKTRTGRWESVGFNLPITSGLAWDGRDPSTLYLAAGNGLIRLADRGARWTILTGSDVTELRDATVDRNAPGTIYFAHTAGIAASADGGKTWRAASGGLKRPYTEAIRVDRGAAGVLIAGMEAGIYRSPDAGASWRRVGAAGWQVLRVEQSPHDAAFWLATTQGGGLFVSHDRGASFENLGRIGVGRNLYDISFDALKAKRIAVAGFGFGVALSEDDGKTWQFRNAGLPATDVWSVAFDADRENRLYASVNAKALYVSDDLGLTWRVDGLPDTAVYHIYFVPESVR